MNCGLIFDVDGVIADTEPLSTRACSEAFHELHGIAVPLDDHLPFMGATSEKHVEGIAAKHEIQIDTAELVKAHDGKFLEALAAAEDIALPGAIELMGRVAGYDDWKLALATSSARGRSEATIGAAGVDVDALCAWITGDQVAKPKPHPEIYLAAALAIGVPPDNCVVIEDSIAGVAAAKGAGMQCVAVTNTFPGEHLRLANRIVDSLEAVDVTMLYDLLSEAA